jgi:hypothetical protein
MTKCDQDMMCVVADKGDALMSGAMKLLFVIVILSKAKDLLVAFDFNHDSH